MGNETPEAAGRSEVMLSASYGDGDGECVCVFVCARGTETFHTNTAAPSVDWRPCLGFRASGLFSHLREFVFSSDMRKHSDPLTEILSNQSVFVGLCGLSLSCGATGYDMHISPLHSSAEINGEFLPNQSYLSSVEGSPYQAGGFCNHPQHVFDVFCQRSYFTNVFVYVYEKECVP